MTKPMIVKRNGKIYKIVPSKFDNFFILWDDLRQVKIYEIASPSDANVRPKYLGKEFPSVFTNYSDGKVNIDAMIDYAVRNHNKINATEDFFASFKGNK